MPKDFAIGLRAVPYMAPRYQSKATPIEGPRLNEFNTDWKDILKICSHHHNLEGKRVSTIREMDKELFLKFLEYDKKVTGKDRSDFLRKFFFDLKFTAGNVLLDSNDDIIAVAAITPTSTKESHMFKIAPIYANTLTDALTVCQGLVEYAGGLDSSAKILFHILSGTRGEQELLPLLNAANISTHLTGVTLFSKAVTNPVNPSLVYIAHNNSGHYDI